MTPRPIVIDASFVLAILLREPEGLMAEELMRDWTRQRRPKLVPAHFWAELVNSLMRGHGFTAQETIDARFRAERFKLTTITQDRAAMLLTIDRMERHGLTSYDALYLVLAETSGAELATFDRKLLAAAGYRAVSTGRNRLSETAAVYEHEVTWPDYKGASAYLAQLRADALRA
jgi:predicted nucleic acid-binding protein